jgi:hypothetical protein
MALALHHEFAAHHEPQLEPLSVNLPLPWPAPQLRPEAKLVGGCCCPVGRQVLDSAGPAALAHLTQLQQLDLTCSGIGSVGLLALAPLTQLTELVLDMCRLGNEGCRVSEAVLWPVQEGSMMHLAGPVAGELAASQMTSLMVEGPDRRSGGCLNVNMLHGKAVHMHLEMWLLLLCCGAVGWQMLLMLQPRWHVLLLLQVFRRLTRLERVDLSDTDVGDVGVMHLGRCKQLSWLSLCNTEVGDCCAASLTELVRRRSIRVARWAIFDGGSSMLCRQFWVVCQQLDLLSEMCCARPACQGVLHSSSDAALIPVAAGCSCRQAV